MKQAIRVMRLDFLTVQEYLSFKSLSLFLGVAIIVSLASGRSSVANGGFATGIILMFGMIFASYPFAIGEKTQMDLFYASLPIRRRDLVRGRYLYALGTQVLAALLSLFISLIVSILSQLDFSFLSYLSVVGICFFVFSLMTMLQMPFYFKMGYSKARLIAIIPLLLIGIGSATLSSVWNNFGEELDAKLQALAQNGFLLALLVLVVYGVVYKISSVLSLRFYEKRDL